MAGQMTGERSAATVPSNLDVLSVEQALKEGQRAARTKANSWHDHDVEFV